MTAGETFDDKAKTTEGRPERGAAASTASHPLLQPAMAIASMMRRAPIDKTPGAAVTVEVWRIRPARAPKLRSPDRTGQRKTERIDGGEPC